MKLLSVVGARPNMMKVAPIIRATLAYPTVQHLLVHTGQHYDAKMSQVFFDELGLPAPDVNLEVGSASHAVQTARVIERFEPVLVEHKPDWVIVVGDVNSTLACALVCAKLGVKVAHVEAGLRSFDRTMPEEINRILTDQISDLLFTTEVSAHTNLGNEGIDPAKIHFVGNVMIDTLIHLLPRVNERTILHDLRLVDAGGAPTPFVLVTLHRPNNVDDPVNLRTLVVALVQLAQTQHVVFPLHPRTRQRLDSLGLLEALAGCDLIEPLGYLDFMALERAAALVLTDSGGVQEETTYLGVPCLTVRPSTERPVTISHGTNRLVECTSAAILQGAREAQAKDRALPAMPPPLWDGHAAERIIRILVESSEP